MMGRLRAMREPLKYVQGRDALYKFHEEMGYMGKRWLFVCSNSGYKTCHDKIEKSFEGLEDYRRYEVFGGISSNGEIKKMEEIVKEDNIDVVVAVGGGSAVDTAKATAYYTGKHIVIVPTVAATDAPVQACLSSTMMITALINICSIRRIRMPSSLTAMSLPMHRSTS